MTYEIIKFTEIYEQLSCGDSHESAVAEADS